MMQACTECSRSFDITDEDVRFYDKIKVPPPTHCPECRARRRYAWRNDKNLYRRTCDLCSKRIVTMYSPESTLTVYCPSCWWGDGWDVFAYGKEFDFSRPFFEQFSELQQSVPRIALVGKNSVNSEYTNHSSDNKNCYMCASTVHCEDVLYGDFVMHSKDSVDVTQIYEKAERCYECTDLRNSYGCQFGGLLKDCTNCLYCYDCRGCTDCFLSVNLRSKSYCFLNEELSPEEYKKKVAEYELGSWKDRKKLYDRYRSLLRENALYQYASMEQSVDSSGNYIYNSKNVRHCFDVENGEDLKYVTSVVDAKDSMDAYRCAEKIELVYECHALVRTYDAAFSNMVYDDAHVQYCDHCFNSQNLFGCIGIKKGEYCIFNKRYSKEEYMKLREKVVEHMKETGEYGQFFPIPLSPFTYNESHGDLYLPVTEDEAKEKGWRWSKNIARTSGKETLTDIPDNIDDVDESTLDAVLKCESCGNNYNIVSPELAFYKKERIPVPHFCFSCRDKQRIHLRTPRKLFDRSCQCRGEVSENGRYRNTREHTHGTDHCPNKFETAYAPDREETVYCKECYQAEVV